MTFRRSPSTEKLATRISRTKNNPFNVTSTASNYTGQFLTAFLLEAGSNKSIRQVLLISRIGSVFDLEIGQELLT